jgi:hypothetical protein
MPNLNVLTWNSTGETAIGAARLREVIDYLVGHGWQPQVIVVQEANQLPGGLIYQMLAGLGNGYNQPPSHAQEGGVAGRGYLMLTHSSVVIQNAFGRLDLGQDAQLLSLINTFAPRPRQIALDELRDMRMPAVAGLICGGAGVGLLTWHTPRGPGQLLTGLTLQGGANPDAFWFLQNSGLYARLTAPGIGNVGVIAGDLNITVQEINRHIGHPDLPYVLPGWVGLSNNLDHIVGHPQPGQPNPTFPVGWNFDAPGTHAILVATTSWQ